MTTHLTFYELLKQGFEEFTLITLFFFFVYMIINNVFGHLGFEMNAPGFTKGKFTRWLNTTTHHSMHHSHFNYNYGLYFNFWDKLMGTNHEKYHETFEKVTAKRAKQKTV
jgi:sterol desaturase/sphingolipid hydroxylase (fatty acid hydroxylase superfamily)